MVENYPLTANTIDFAAERVTVYCEAQKMSAQDALKYRLSAEEVLGSWLDAGINTFTLCMGERSFELSAPGAARNPFTEDDEDSFLLRGLRASQENTPKYSYRRGRNTVSWHIARKKSNPILKLLLMICSGAAMGLALKYLLPAQTCEGLLTNIIDPVYSTFFRLLGYIAGPLILLSVVWGIYGIGDAGTFGKLGKRLLLTCLVMLVAVTFCLTFTFPLFGLRLAGETGAGSSFGSILSMILDIIPSDILSPFVSGNSLQIIFTAVVLGVAMLLMGKRAQAVGALVEQGNGIVQHTMGVISRMIPVLIPLIIARLVMTDTFAAAGSLWKFVLLFVGFSAMLIVLLTVGTSIYVRVSPFTLLKKCAPVMLIALTTASSSACLSENIRTSEERLGVSHRLVGFGLPLCTVLFKINFITYTMCIAFFYGHLGGIECSAGWLITAAITCFLLSVAVPPVAGGAIVGFSVIFAQLGIPTDLITIVVSLDVLCDFVNTTVCMYALQMALLCAGHGMGEVDRGALCR